MQRNTRAPVGTSQHACERARRAAVAIVRRTCAGNSGRGASRSELGEVVETVKQMEAQVSSRKRDSVSKHPVIPWHKPKKECHTLFLR